MFPKVNDKFFQISTGFEKKHVKIRNYQIFW